MIRSTLFLLIIVLFSTCKKGETSWDVDVLIPLGYGVYNLDDILEDSLLEVGDSNELILVWNQNVVDLDLESIGTIPDTTINYEFSLPFVTQFDFPPGSEFPTPLNEIDLSINQAKLTEAVIKQGEIIFNVINPISERLVVKYELPSVILSGQVFTIIDTVPASANSVPSNTTSIFDLSDYELDLTGENGNGFNELISDLTITTDPFGNTVTIFNTDTIKVNIVLHDILPAYAKGSFDTQELETEAEEFDVSIGDIMDASLNINEIQSVIRIENGFGVDISFQLSELIGIQQTNANSVALDHAIFGNTINLTRATDINGLSPFIIEIFLDQDNSNIEEFIENLPDLIQISTSGTINPLGNISGGNDFVYCESKIKVDLITEIPLDISISGLSISDTILLGEITPEDFEDINSALMIAELTNSFPLSISPEFYLIDSNNLILLESLDDSDIQGGSISPTGVVTPRVTRMRFKLDKLALDIIEQNEKILVEVLFNSENPSYPILSSHQLEIKFGLDANYDLQLN